MKARIIASTKIGYEMEKEEAMILSGEAAGICYLADSLDKLFEEDNSKTIKRATNILSVGHHSIFSHPTYTIVFEDIPKIVAMIINNEKMYATSEKSARYTKMAVSEEEMILYKKWISLFKEQIIFHYPKISFKKAEKLAQENARYLISVFTPSTTLAYTTNIRQLNYIIAWSKNYINDKSKKDAFSLKVKEALKDFLATISSLEIEGLNANMKGREFSLFATRKRKEEFGENYCTTYSATFAELAQAQRHRTINYEMSVPSSPSYYIPKIIRNTGFENLWLQDINSLSRLYPQGMLVTINERGTIENFVQKCFERLCGSAQLEIMDQTKNTLNKYLENVKDEKELYEYLETYSKGARCVFPGWSCNLPCMFGGKHAMERII